MAATLIPQLRQSTLPTPSGNVTEEDMNAIVEAAHNIQIGTMFAVPVDEEISPYKEFDELDWEVTDVNGNDVLALVVDPPEARQRFHRTRVFNKNDVLRWMLF